MKTDSALVNGLIINVLGGDKVRWVSLPVACHDRSGDLWQVGAGPASTSFISCPDSQHSVELFEACEIDGANVWQRFRYLTVPLLNPP